MKFKGNMLTNMDVRWRTLSAALNLEGSISFSLEMLLLLFLYLKLLQFGLRQHQSHRLKPKDIFLLSNLSKRYSKSLVYIRNRFIRNSRGGGVTCICRDMGMCHYFGYFFGGCSRIFGYLFELFRDFWVSFLAIPGFLGIIFDKIWFLSE